MNHSLRVDRGGDLCPLFILFKGDGIMNPSFRDQLKQWKKKNGMQHKDPPIVESPKKSPPRKKDKFSETDLQYLMGTEMKTMRRGRGGAWRNGR